jgi:hypothetical protein
MSRPMASSRMGATLIAVVCVTACIRGAVQAEERLSIKYVNGLDEAISLWFQPQGAATFLRPPVDMGPRTEKAVPLSERHRGWRYIVIRDEGYRDTRVGWIDLEAIARSRTPLMLIEGVYVQKTRTECYVIYRPVYETVRGSDGCTRSIRRWVPEQRTRAVPITVRVISLKILVDGKWQHVQLLTGWSLSALGGRNSGFP